MTKMTTKHSHNTKSGLCTLSVGQIGHIKYAYPVIELRPNDWSGSRGSCDLLYGDSIALISVCRSKMPSKVLSFDTAHTHRIVRFNLNGRAIDSRAGIGSVITVTLGIHPEHDLIKRTDTYLSCTTTPSV